MWAHNNIINDYVGKIMRFTHTRSTNSFEFIPSRATFPSKSSCMIATHGPYWKVGYLGEEVSAG